MKNVREGRKKNSMYEFVQKTRSASSLRKNDSKHCKTVTIEKHPD